MRTINNRKYSTKSFKGYKIRLKIERIDKEGETHIFDVYTTQICPHRAFGSLQSITTKKTTSLKMLHHATKEQDDATSEMIDNWLN
jgi:hypothetical protein